MQTKRKKILFILTVVGSLILISGLIWVKLKNNPKQANNLNTLQEASPNSESTQQPPTSTQNNEVTPKNSSPDPIKIPTQPVLTKSSGNNGPVPAGSNMNFICSAEPNIDCSVILTYNGKQIVLGPSKVTDNGRGQYFASFYWASVKGSYKVTAQAKNSQGGVSSSITQALEVQ